MAFLLSLEGDPVSRFAPLRRSVLRARPASSRARYQTFLGPGPLKRAGGMIFPVYQVLDAGELTGPGGVGPGGATRAHRSPVRAPQ